MKRSTRRKSHLRNLWLKPKSKAVFVGKSPFALRNCVVFTSFITWMLLNKEEKRVIKMELPPKPRKSVRDEIHLSYALNCIYYSCIYLSVSCFISYTWYIDRLVVRVMKCNCLLMRPQWRREKIHPVQSIRIQSKPSNSNTVLLVAISKLLTVSYFSGMSKTNQHHTLCIRPVNPLKQFWIPTTRFIVFFYQFRKTVSALQQWPVSAGRKDIKKCVL